MSEKKYVYSFEEGSKDMKPLLGGKGANLSEMKSLGIPVPPGFTITTEVCQIYNENNRQLPENIRNDVDEKLKELEDKIGKKLGDESDPLLVSVRSGAAVSMPGMMDTVLNLGLNDKSVEGMAQKTQNERFAWDAYRRFIQMFGDVVMGIDLSKFEDRLEKAKETKGVKNDTDLDVDDLKKLVEEYKEVVRQEKNDDFPQDPKEQLLRSIDAVFGSWNNDRAIAYRRMNNITNLLGTAVNVQAMVFGNLGEESGTGVAFSRDPSTGDKTFYGEFLMNAQGEDVVAGIRTPEKLEDLKQKNEEAYNKLVEVKDKLEEHYGDMQDIEFTIQEGELYLLQTRNGKRTAPAAIKIAVDFVEEEKLSKEQALLKIDPEAISQLLHKRLDPVGKKEHTVLAKGLPASPGAAVGEVVFTADEAHQKAQEGRDVILVRTETSPEDVEGMNSARGVLTSRGGMTSHAAVVARGMGKCCIAGCEDAKINESEKTVTFGEETFKEGDYITLDGTSGEILKGQVPVIDPEMSGNFATILQWSDEMRKLNVRTNADKGEDAKKALEYGAEGIGLTRTEHMFFEGDRIKSMRKMILAKDKEGRKSALDELLPYQRDDFKSLFEAMDGKPVTIRLLDPPLHEFVPHEENDIKELAESMGMSFEEVKQKIEDLKEANPMLGHRGCRLGITYPEITEMQAKAIFEAAKETNAIPEVMIPLVGNVEEFKNQKQIVVDVAKEVGVEQYKVGTMIEVPRGAITADEIAQEAEFFSFGTNDLTQMTLGFSRDDAGKFINEYREKGIYNKDPFQSLDQNGVGQLVKSAADKGKSSREDIKLGICGEHGGDPDSIEFCHESELHYVSCSPFRVPVARVAAAQAAVKKKE